MMTWPLTSVLGAGGGVNGTAAARLPDKIRRWHETDTHTHTHAHTTPLEVEGGLRT